jgi:hypothetical protein
MFIMKTCPWLINFIKVLCDSNVINVTNLFHVFKVFIAMNKISFRFYIFLICVSLQNAYSHVIINFFVNIEVFFKDILLEFFL